jgi:hypothetical protein
MPVLLRIAPGSFPVAAIAIALCTVVASGCASKRAYMGHSATDLSAVSAGAPRAAVDEALGQPEKTESRGDALTAWYVYDRGYVGNLENNSAGAKLAWAPVMAFGEMVSLGLAGWMTACATPCQKGLLQVEYDSEARVVGAVESFLPDDHPVVADCARSPVRGEVGVCLGVRQKVRGSTLGRGASRGPE